jgi:hypothetical protein
MQQAPRSLSPPLFLFLSAFTIVWLVEPRERPVCRRGRWIFLNREGRTACWLCDHDRQQQPTGVQPWGGQQRNGTRTDGLIGLD